MEPEPGKQRDQKEWDQRDPQIDDRRHDPCKGIDIFGHIYLFDQAGVAHDGPQRHPAGLREEVKGHNANKKVYCVIGDVASEDRGKDKVLHTHHQKRIEEAPEHPQYRAFVLGLEIPCHQLPDQEPVLLHRNDRVDNIAVLSFLKAIPDPRQQEKQQRKARGGKLPVMQPGPNIICACHGEAKRPGHRLPVYEKLPGAFLFLCLRLEVHQRRGRASRLTVR